jgi:hypothetical protein
MGSLPPIGEGFSLFTRAPNIYEQIKTNLNDEIKLAMTSPYDSHPTLPDRVVAAESPRRHFSAAERTTGTEPSR